MHPPHLTEQWVKNYILSTGHGSHMAGGSWINTGEGGIAPEHLKKWCRCGRPNWPWFVWFSG
ncbi:hypothetical protein GCM10020331_004800 [Ectobacillus funiculus]